MRCSSWPGKGLYLAEDAALCAPGHAQHRRDRHHVVEAAFKALGLALSDALAPAPGVFSTKGAVHVEERHDESPARLARPERA